LRLSGGLALAVGFLILSGTVRADRPLPLPDKAKKAEASRDWLEACRCYDELLRKKPKNAELREAYARCLRQLQLVSRHNDSSYRQTVGKLKYEDALTTYDQVVKYLHYAHAERERVELSALVKQGLTEVHLALNDPVFKRHYLKNVQSSAITTFANRVKSWPVDKVSGFSDAKALVRKVIVQAGDDGLPTDGPLASALVMEFAAGACNGVDEHSCFLTPTHLTLMQSASRSRPACVGIVAKEDAGAKGGFRVGYVIPKSPAAQIDPQIQEGDWILEVNNEDVEGLTLDEVTKRLQPKANTTIDVKLARAGDKQDQRTVKLTSSVNNIPSVHGELMGLPDGQGYATYLRINYFAEDTPRELTAEIERLKGAPSKGIILDLRGNPGGVLPASISVAEMFLSGGVVSISQSPVPEHNRPAKVESPGPHAAPLLVVLVDAETASAAEVLVAALKEGRREGRTLVMGQTTYGKGSVQRLITLKHAPLDKTAGIRLTVAKLFSPSNLAINGKGITPDETLALDVNALEAAKKWLAGIPEMMMEMPAMRPEGPKDDVMS